MIKALETKQRVKGALMGAFIGDALGLGAHWYYDLDEQHKDYGTWIDDYTTPKKGRYHEHQKAGDLSQSGFILKLMLNSLLDNQGYNHESFCQKLQTDLLSKINGEAMSGPGGYTSQSIREIYKQRVQQKLPWDKVGTHADTTESLERTLALAVRYAFEPNTLAKTITQNSNLTQIDEIVGAINVAYGALLAQLLQGEPFDEHISSKLMNLVKQKALPFHAVTKEGLKPPKAGFNQSTQAGSFASPDALLTPSYMAKAANDSNIQIEPAWKVSLVYGMPCAIYHVIPAVYYLSARFNDDFESGVLHAINGGGQNQSRAILTGTLIGAQVGIDNIPARFIDGLNEQKELLDLIERFAEQLID